VRQVVGRVAREGKCTLVVDATGLGAPVVDMLRIASLRREIVPVLLTGGEGEFSANGVWHVPKRDLITGLQLMLERRELAFRRGYPQPEI